MAVAAIDAIKSRSMVACRLAKVDISQHFICKNLSERNVEFFVKLGGS